MALGALGFSWGVLFNAPLIAGWQNITLKSNVFVYDALSKNNQIMIIM